MAVDKGYGSGKSRSAANSSARRRVAAGKLTKSKPKTGVTLDKVAKAAGNVVDFAFNGPKENQGKYLEVGVSPFKILQAARALVAAGKLNTASMLEARVSAKLIGQGKRGSGTMLDIMTGKEARRFSKSVFPKLPIRGGDSPRLIRGSRDTRTFDKYSDPINEGAGRFKSQNLLDTMIQGSKTRSGMNQVKVASEVAKKLAKYKTPKRGR